MPLDLAPITLDSGQSVPRTLDIESYFVRFIGEGDGLSAETSLEANFIFRVGKLPDAAGYLKTDSAGRVQLSDEVLKGFPHYAELVTYLGNALYSAWLAQNPGYTPQQP